MCAFTFMPMFIIPCQTETYRSGRSNLEVECLTTILDTAGLIGVSNYEDLKDP